MAAEIVDQCVYKLCFYSRGLTSSTLIPEYVGAPNIYHPSFSATKS
jgi:hypothetical protein